MIGRLALRLQTATVMPCRGPAARQFGPPLVTVISRRLRAAPSASPAIGTVTPRVLRPTVADRPLVVMRPSPTCDSPAPPRPSAMRPPHGPSNEGREARQRLRGQIGMAATAAIWPPSTLQRGPLRPCLARPPPKAGRPVQLPLVIFASRRL